jgi:DNA-binding SARP family transcriptional activator
VEFRVLGPIEVIDDDGHSLALGGTRPRALLAALVLESGRAITRDALIAGLWETPPPSASHAVEVYASKLRKTVGHGRILCHGHAYRAELEPDELDLGRFRALTHVGRAAAAAGDPHTAAQTLGAALAHWRGEPLACLDGEPLAADARGYLSEERLAVHEAEIDVRLALGHHDELVPELRRLIASHPTRERLHGRLMLALYRSERQLDALDVYARLHRRLHDEVGLAPGPDLQRLQQRILAHDPSLLSDGAAGRPHELVSSR